jgi:hypothetical protein
MDVLLTDMKKVNARHALDLTGDAKRTKKGRKETSTRFSSLSVSFAPLR